MRLALGITAAFVCACSHPPATATPEPSTAASPPGSLSDYVGVWVGHDEQFGHDNRIQIEADGSFDQIISKSKGPCGMVGTVELIESDGPAFQWHLVHNTCSDSDDDMTDRITDHDDHRMVLQAEYGGSVLYQRESATAPATPLSPFAGTWQTTTNGFDERMEIDADGHFRLHVKRSDDTCWAIGTVTYDDDRPASLHWMNTIDSCAAEVEGASTTDIVELHSDQKLVLGTPGDTSGSTVTWTRE